MVPKFPADDDRKIILAGTEWLLPAKLRGKQLKKVCPRLMLFGVAMAQSVAHMVEIPTGGGNVSRVPMVSEDQLEQLSQAYYYALTYNYPDLKMEVFDNMAYDMAELFAGLPIIQASAGFEKSAAGVPPTGEAGAPASQTGTN